MTKYRLDKPDFEPRPGPACGPGKHCLHDEGHVDHPGRLVCCECGRVGYAQRGHDNRAIAVDRPESEPCERLTPGCSIDHSAEGPGEGSCETW